MSNPELFRCICSSNEHIFIIDKDHDEKEIYVSVHLRTVPFLKRIKNSIKYIFNISSPYGHYEEIILSELETKRLIKSLSSI